MTDAIKLAIEAPEDLIESATGVDQVSAVNQARTAIAALRTQPVRVTETYCVKYEPSAN